MNLHNVYDDLIHNLKSLRPTVSGFNSVGEENAFLSGFNHCKVLLLEILKEKKHYKGE